MKIIMFESCKVRFDSDHATPVQHFRLQIDNPISPNSNNGSSNINYFIRYLACYELVVIALVQFKDKPQKYRGRKRSSQTATSSLNLEMDLLLTWLSKEAAENVEQMSAMHINHSEAGLAMIRDRHDQTYGSTENAVLKQTLFQIGNEPKFIWMELSTSNHPAS